MAGEIDSNLSQLEQSPLNQAGQMTAMKKVLRQQVLQAREQLKQDLRDAAEAAITQRLSLMPEYRQANSVLGYMNFGTEYASTLWIAQVLEQGKRLALPKVNRDKLELYWVNDLKSQLAPGAWGIKEPLTERCVPLRNLEEIDFVLLPGVAFTKQGARLGYGKGYYDRLLENQHGATLVAAAFSMQIIEHIPQDATDLKVQWLVTETASYYCCVT